MKRWNLLACAAAVAALAACTREPISTSVAPGEFRAGLEIPTRVAFSDEGVFSWNEGDAVALVTNAGLKTFTLTSGAGSAQGNFSGDLSGVTSASAAIYPAAIAKDAATVTLPAEYTWVKDQTHAAMIASPVTLEGVNHFKHVGGIVKIVCSTIPSEADAMVFSAGARITGDFAVEGGVIKAGAGSGEVVIHFPAGSDPEAFYVPVPTGEYKFSVSFRKGTETVGQVRETSEARKIGRATLLLMDDSGIGIRTAEDLVAWAAARNADKPTAQWEYEPGCVALLNDIDMSGVAWTPVKKLPEKFVFDGKGHALKNWTAACGKDVLFQNNYGTVRDLVLDESCKFTWTQGIGGGFVVDTLRLNGVIEKVVNRATAATFTDALTTAPCHFNYITHVIYGAVRDCENYGDINIDVPSTTQNIWAAGIGAFFNCKDRVAADGGIAVSGCRNYGDVTVHIAGYGRKSYIAGVVGGTTDAGSYANQTAMKGVVEKCENYGNVTYKYDTSWDGSYYNVGGVCAYVEGQVFDCVNEGKVTTSVPLTMDTKGNTRPAVAGVAAFVRFGIARCTNKGDVDVSGLYGAGSLTATGCGMNANPSFAGVVAQVGPTSQNSEFTLTDLHNEGTVKTNLSMPMTNGTNCFIGGVIGITYYPIFNCDNKGRLDVTSRERYTFVGGVVGKPFNRVENCWNEGKIDYNYGDMESIGPNTGGAANQRSQAAYVGGLIGDINAGSPAAVVGCENRRGADVTLKGGYTYTTLSHCGGLIGRSDGGIGSIEGCVNYGHVNTGDIPRCIRAGGIAGQANTKKFDNCQNYGNVTSVMSHANASTGGLAGFTTSNTVLNACSSQSDVTSSGTLGAASLFVGGQGNTKQTWDNSTLGGNLVVSGDIIGAYIQGWFVNPDAAKAAVTVGSVAPLKIKAGSTFNGVAVSAADLVLDRLFGAPGVAVVTCPEGAVVIE